MAWAVVNPFQAAVGAFQRVVYVVIACEARTRVGLRKRHLIVKMNVLGAEAASAGSAGSFGILFAKPALHVSTPY
jgi:hypothetical protein